MKQKATDQVLLSAEELDHRIAPTGLTDLCGLVVTTICPPPPSDCPPPPPPSDCPPPSDSTTDGNNGWGNGEDAAPGGSAEAQPGFEDPYTGASPSNSAESADGDR